MVNLTSLELIHQFIKSDTRIRKMKRWSDRFRYDSENKLSSYLRKMKKQIFEILSIISGDDIVEMLKGLNF